MYKDKDKFIILITGGRSSGKALPLDEAVLTPWGYKKIALLVEGEYICSVDGGMQRITQLHPIEVREYVRISFDDGSKIECSREHLWEVYVNGVRSVAEAQNLKGKEQVRLGEANRAYYDYHPTAPLVCHREEEGRPVFIKKGITDLECQMYREQKRFVRKFSYKNELYAYISFAKKYKTIIRVENVGKRVGRCISVSDKSGLFFTRNATITHNSFQTGTFIERLTFELGETEGKRIAHQILYTRYTMVSAGISVIPEFMDKIEADGTSKYFHKTKTDVTNVSTGSRVMFRGINTSSGNQTAKLKSIHGITTFVVDEAEEWTSEQEFDTIMLSIRQKGLQNRIIVIMNPSDSNHFIYQRYIKDTHRIEMIDGVPVQISTHPNVLHIHTTYLDNIEHCGEQFLKEVRDMKEKNPEKYAHIVIGRWADVAEGAIFKKWGIVDEFPSNARNVGRGLDFGFSLDPSACVKFGEVYTAEGVDLYLDEQFYQTGMLISDLIRELKKDPTFVYADSADPRLIDEIGLGGVIIYGVVKGAGSILAGIEKMLDYNHIYVTKRSYNLQEELRNYTWDKDKNGNYISQPIDAYNHACFIGETLVTTKCGKKRIDEITTSDYVLTRKGYKRVLKVYNNDEKEVITKELVFNKEKVELCATSDHKIYANASWKKYEHLIKGDKCLILSNSTEGCIGEERIINIIDADGTKMVKKTKSFCTTPFITITMAIFQKVISFIIWTKTHSTTVLKILLQYHGETTCESTITSVNSEGNIQKNLNRSVSQEETIKNDGQNIGTQCNQYRASIVGKNSYLVVKERNSVQPDAMSSGACMRIVTWLKEFVWYVASRFKQVNTEPTKRVQQNVPMSEKVLEDVIDIKRYRAEVYNLEVEDEHEFFANGMLVHNCDAARYGVLGKIMGKVIRKEMKQGNSGKRPVAFSLN
ncbi:MAG: phage terminase large subunit [Prevotella sp.]|nr:phage terminase large subunit [Candidatus Prevotella equi]